MAITWTLNINEIIKNRKATSSFSVSATVVDDMKPIGNQEETVSVADALMDTPARKQSVWDNLKSQYEAKAAKTNFTAAMELEGKEELEK